MKNKISAYVVSYNRADTIYTVLRSLNFVDELILIDKGSADSTLELATPLVDKVISIPWSPTVESTRKLAEELCSNDWIVFLDDDECLSIEAIKFLQNELSNPSASIYKIPQRHYIAGHHSENAYYWPESQIRVYKKGSIEFSNKVHGGYQLRTDDVYQIPFDIGVFIYHFSHKSISEWIEKANRYTSQVERLRMSDPASGNDLILYSHRAIDRWVTKKDLHGNNSSYEAMVALLRAVYDIIDRLKVWEEERGIPGHIVFKELCQKLNKEYEQYYSYITDSTRNSISINLPKEITENNQQEGKASSDLEFIDIAGKDLIVAGSKLDALTQINAQIREDAVAEITALTQINSQIREDAVAEIERLKALLEHQQQDNLALIKSLEMQRQSHGDELLHLENIIKSEKESYRNFESSIYRSTSWRLSAPIRFFSSMVRKYAALIKSVAIRLILIVGKRIFYSIPVDIKKKNLWMYSVYQFPFAKLIFKDTPHYQAYKKSIEPTIDVEPPLIPIASAQISDTEYDEVINSLNFLLSDDPIVSIIIPTFGKLDITLNCLRSISRHIPKCTYEIIVIEDCSGELEIQRIGEVRNIQFIQNTENLGFTLTCNKAALMAKGKFLYFLNNDTEITGGAIDYLLNVFESFPACGLAGSKLIYPNGYLQEAGGIVWASGNAWNFGRMQNPNNYEFNYIKEVDYCSGASIMIKKEIFIKLGCFDEIYAPAYCEDTDLAFKVRDSGLKVYYQPASVVIHYEGKSHGIDVNKGIKSFQVINQNKFRQKWSHSLGQQIEREEDLFWARDRTWGKKTILMIDHHLPKYDQDAGSKTLDQIIQFLVEKDVHTILYPLNLAYEEIYTKHYQQKGIQVIYSNKGPSYLDEFFEANANYIDGIFISRPTVAKEIFKVIKKFPHIKTYFYGHDIHHIRMKMELEIQGKFPVNVATKKMESLEHECWENFDRIYYPSIQEVEIVNKYLMEKLLAEKATRLPILMFKDNEVSPREYNNQPNGLIFIGGFGHAPNLSGILWFLEKVWPSVSEVFPSLVLHIVGSNTPYELKTRRSKTVVIHGFLSESNLKHLYSQNLISIAPLLYGGGIKGKIIEALSCGMPVIATSVGNQGLDGENSGLLIADDPKSFIEAIFKLMNDSSLCSHLSKNAVNFIKREFSTQSMTIALKEVL